MTHVRSVFTARNAVLLGVLVLVGALSSADVALPLQARVPAVVLLMCAAVALVLWNRVVPLGRGGVAHLPARVRHRPARRDRRAPS